MKEPLLRLTQLWRAYGRQGRRAAQYRVGNVNAAFGQGPLQSPSVFNFFSPFYAPPGEIADQGLVSPGDADRDRVPEHARSTNYFYNPGLRLQLDRGTGLPANAIVLDIRGRGRARRATPRRWSRRIAEKMLGGQISRDAQGRGEGGGRARCRRPTRGQRVAEALYLVATSPEYVVQR